MSTVDCKEVTKTPKIVEVKAQAKVLRIRIPVYS